MTPSTAVDFETHAAPMRNGKTAPPHGTELRLDVWLRRKGQCVFNCWTIPEYMEVISSANGAPVRASSELSEGGQFTIISSQGGRDRMLAEGTYLVLDSPHYIKCAWNFYHDANVWKSVLRLHLTEMDGGMQLRLIQSGGNPQPAVVEAQKLWWKQRFILMRKLLA